VLQSNVKAWAALWARASSSGVREKKRSRERGTRGCALSLCRRGQLSRFCELKWVRGLGERPLTHDVVRQGAPEHPQGSTAKTDPVYGDEGPLCRLWRT